MISPAELPQIAIPTPRYTFRTERRKFILPFAAAAEGEEYSRERIVRTLSQLRSTRFLAVATVNGCCNNVRIVAPTAISVAHKGVSKCDQERVVAVVTRG